MLPPHPSFSHGPESPVEPAGLKPKLPAILEAANIPIHYPKILPPLPLFSHGIGTPIDSAL